MLLFNVDNNDFTFHCVIHQGFQGEDVISQGLAGHLIPIRFLRQTSLNVINNQCWSEAELL